MPKCETLKTILELIGTWLVVFFGTAAIPSFFPTITIISSIIAAIGLSIYGVLYFRQNPEKTDPKHIVVSKSTANSSAVLEVTPLSYVKGNGADVNPSQMIYGLFGSHVDGVQTEYIAKFGVLRVKALNGNAYKCRASAKIKVTHQLGRYNPQKWEDVGMLNWFSTPRKEQLDGKFDRLANLKDYGLNKYLKNETTTILENTEKDLLVMYMVKGNPKVFICNNGDTRVIGWVEPNKFLKFTLELTLSAQNNPLTTCQYLVSVLWDDYKFSTTLGSRESTRGITG